VATDLDRPNSGPRTAKHALLVPLTVLLVMVLSIGLIATLLLFNTKMGALVLAAVVAAGVLFTISLMASRDRLDGRQRFVAVGAGVLPLLVGALVAGGLIGGVADEDRMINVQPLQVTPEDAPFIAAENSEEFCLPDPETGEGCEPIDAWEFIPSAEEDTVAFVFDNREAGVPHNVAITTLAGSEGEPEAGEEIFVPDTISGPATEYYVSDIPIADLPEEFYFFCSVHPNMNGVGTVTAPE
jgi:hypothetical protein